jgi:hypothetical protein
MDKFFAALMTNDELVKAIKKAEHEIDLLRAEAAARVAVLTLQDAKSSEYDEYCR